MASTDLTMWYYLGFGLFISLLGIFFYYMYMYEFQDKKNRFVMLRPKDQNSFIIIGDYRFEAGNLGILSQPNPDGSRLVSSNRGNLCAIYDDQKDLEPISKYGAKPFFIRYNPDKKQQVIQDIQEYKITQLEKERTDLTTNKKQVIQEIVDNVAKLTKTSKTTENKQEK